MPVVIDEVTVNVAPPPAPADPAAPAAPAGPPAIDPPTLQRELQRLAERAARLSAD